MTLLKKNAGEANILVAKVMRITFVIFTLIYLLNVIGIFVVDKSIMTIAYLISAALLWMPTILVKMMKQDKDYIAYIPYVNVICAALFVTVLSITLTYHVVAIYVYPIAIASLYFSKLLNIVATGLTVIGTSVGQVMAFYMDTLQDDNFTEFDDTIIFGVIPRALVVIAVAAIFTTLCSRTAAMLSNLMGAEEQKEMLERMRLMKDNAAQSSESMVVMVTELACITENSLQANQSISSETEKLLAGSTENTVAIERVDDKIQDISEQLTALSSLNHRTAALTDHISENTRENQRRMDDATNSMEQIHTSTNACKQIISSLGEESKEIIGIVETITYISGQTNILALNASIEAARAGEHGRGFAVVAEEIQQLSEQTKTAVDHIGKIVHEVVKNTENAVAAMEQNANATQKGMDSIRKANESATLITSSNEELAGQIHEIDKAAEVIRKKSGEVADNMKQISNNTQLNCSAVELVTAATQENAAGTESLADIVEQIKSLSEQLNKVVQG